MLVVPDWEEQKAPVVMREERVWVEILDNRLPHKVVRPPEENRAQVEEQAFLVVLDKVVGMEKKDYQANLEVLPTFCMILIRETSFKGLRFSSNQ